MIPPRLDFRHLKRRITVEQVLAANGCLEGFTKRGDRLIGSCPVHGGHNPAPSSTVSRSQNLWYCFTGCPAGGDVVQLARRILGLSFRETARYLAHLAQKHQP